MGQKDISEKLLEDYNDVFADIVDVLLFDGDEVIKEEDLSPSTIRQETARARARHCENLERKGNLYCSYWD